MRRKQQLAEIAMRRFELRATELGLVVARPIVEGMRYDVILDDGRLRPRVQVKYTDQRRGDGVINLRIKPPYQADDIDALIVWLPTLDFLVWLPVKEIAGRGNIGFCLDGNRRRTLFDPFAYRW